jgi:hypothetical protein
MIPSLLVLIKNGFSPAYLPQHFLYFFPLPHGQGALRPTFFSTSCGFGQFSKISKSAISSGLCGSNSILYFQLFCSKILATYFILFLVFTWTTAGFFSVPNFAAFLPLKIFFIVSPLEYYYVHKEVKHIPYERDPNRTKDYFESNIFAIQANKVC